MQGRVFRTLDVVETDIFHYCRLSGSQKNYFQGVFFVFFVDLLLMLVGVLSPFMVRLFQGSLGKETTS